MNTDTRQRLQRYAAADAKLAAAVAVHKIASSKSVATKRASVAGDAPAAGIDIAAIIAARLSESTI
jgi:hypothetical protein